jgi:hypothetical protein
MIYNENIIIPKTCPFQFDTTGKEDFVMPVCVGDALTLSFFLYTHGFHPAVTSTTKVAVIAIDNKGIKLAISEAIEITPKVISYGLSYATFAVQDGNFFTKISKNTTFKLCICMWNYVTDNKIPDSFFPDNILCDSNYLCVVEDEDNTTLIQYTSDENKLNTQFTTPIIERYNACKGDIVIINDDFFGEKGDIELKSEIVTPVNSRNPNSTGDLDTFMIVLGGYYNNDAIMWLFTAGGWNFYNMRDKTLAYMQLEEFPYTPTEMYIYGWGGNVYYLSGYEQIKWLLFKMIEWGDTSANEFNNRKSLVKNEIDVYVLNVIGYNNLQYSIRVQGIFDTDCDEQSAENTQYQGQEYQTVKMFQHPYSSYTVTLGHKTGLPMFMREKLNYIFQSDWLRVNGEQVTKFSDNATFEVKDTMPNGNKSLTISFQSRIPSHTQGSDFDATAIGNTAFIYEDNNKNTILTL